MFKDGNREIIKKAAPVEIKEIKETPTPLNNISNIFGTAEVLESN
jgi:hypothetical protein